MGNGQGFYPKYTIYVICAGFFQAEEQTCLCRPDVLQYPKASELLACFGQFFLRNLKMVRTDHNDE